MGLRMDCLISRILLQIACSYKCQFWTKVYAFLQGWSLKFKEWLTKYKERVLDVSDSNENIETPWNSKLKFTELEDLSLKKGAEKLIKDDRWIM